VLAVIKVAPAVHPRVMPSRDGHFLRLRFKSALLGETAFGR
jgi:hypothetical protein